MAEIKWIKIVTDIFDDEKMLMIETLPSADSIMVIWFKLLCLAGKSNNSGVFIFNDRIPYTEEMLAAIFRRDISVVRLAIKTFVEFGMIEVVNNVFTIPNWSKHQTLDSYERQKERDRLKKQKKRAEQKALIAAKSGDASGDKSGDASGDVPALDIEVEEEVEVDKEKDIEIPTGSSMGKPSTPSVNADDRYIYVVADDGQSMLPIRYEHISSMYNRICKSFPQCTAMSEARKKAIKARFASGYTEAHFRTLFTKAEASSFLKGKNDRNWRANFDWLLKDANMAKVLDGNYDDRKRNGGSQGYDDNDLDFIPN